MFKTTEELDAYVRVEKIVTALLSLFGFEAFTPLVMNKLLEHKDKLVKIDKIIGGVYGRNKKG